LSSGFLGSKGRDRRAHASGAACSASGGGTRGRAPWGLVVLAAVASLFLCIAVAGCGGSPTVPVSHCGVPGIICTVIGNGARAFAGEGAPALETSLYFPIDVKFDPQGRALVIDWNNQRLRRLDTDGHLRTIMGTGLEGPVLEGAPGLQTTMHHTYSMCLDAAGDIYLAGNHQPLILQLDTQGIVHIVAGGGETGFAGDGGDAKQAKFRAPCGVAVAPGGRPIYVADTGNERLRLIDVAGVVTTLAGSDSGYAGDGGPAAQAKFRRPYRVRYDATTGDVYVCDSDNHAVRRIDAGGTITTVAGTGLHGFSGDGGPATQAQLYVPQDVAIAPDGVLYIADTGNHRIRRIDAGGTITSVAGMGTAGFSGDGGPATQARLDSPASVTLDSHGNLWIADSFNNRIRVVWK
jgi:sugar lactone lactonase YvrE